MQADPAMRYAAAEEMAADLEAFVAAPRRRRTLLTALAAGALGIAAAVAVWYFTRGATPDRRDIAAPNAGKTDAQRYAESFLGRPMRHDFWVKMEVVGATPDPSGQLTLVEGEKVVLRVEADRDCYLGVWQIDPQGKVTQLFPSKYDPDHLVRAGHARSIPGKAGYAIRASLAQGPEYLFLAASTHPWELQAGQHVGPYAVFETPAERTRWEEKVRGLDLTPEPDGSPTVAEAIWSFLVRAKQR
jgi:hypothetical protein